MSIVGKVWNIKGGNNTGKNISSSINYITNEEKCSKVIECNDLQLALDYINDSVKTLEKLYVGGMHILSIDDATDEMMAVKSFYGKNDKRVALHGIISIEDYESNDDSAAKLMLLASDFLNELFPSHQAVFAVHTNTKNYHVHFVINSVGLDGKKIHMGKNYMKDTFQPALNRLARKYGFEENLSWNKNVKDSMSIKDRKIMLRRVIDKAIEKSEDFSEFVEYLRRRGFRVNVGKYLSLKNEDMKRAMRSYTLGQDYSIDRIRERIREKKEPLDVTDISKISIMPADTGVTRIIVNTLKPYEKMTREEKNEAIRLLKFGRNPWKEQNTNNWMIKMQDEEIQSDKTFVSLVKYYAPISNEPKAAMVEILRLQKNLGENIKEIRKDLRKNRQVVKLFEESEKYAKRAFSYMLTGDKEYEEDYIKYKDIEKRLIVNFNKSIDEVREYKTEQDNNICYLKAQLNALKEQYKLIYKYVNKEPIKGLFELIGHSKAKEEAYYYGIYKSDEKYIYDKDSDYYIYVQTTPGVKNGKPTIDTRIDIYNSQNEVIRSIDSRDFEAREFNKEINNIEKTYGFDKPILSKERPIRQRNV